MMKNTKPEVPIGKRATAAHEDWFTRIQRAKIARAQGQMAREGKLPVNPIRRAPLSRNHD